MRKLSALLLVLVVAPFTRAEEIDNPAYKSWSGFKVGTTVTMKTSSDFAGQKSESVMVSKLVELTPDKAVVEMTVTSKVAGMEFTAPPQKQEQPKKIKKEGTAPDMTKKPDGVVKEGEETVKVSGKDYKAKFYETKIKNPNGDGDIEGKSWISESVPGMLVKMESKVSGKFGGSMTMEITEIKTP